MRVLARRGERFLVLGEPAEENLGGWMRRARAAARAPARAPSGAPATGRLGGAWRFSGGAKTRV